MVLLRDPTLALLRAPTWAEQGFDDCVACCASDKQKGGGKLRGSATQSD